MSIVRYHSISHNQTSIDRRIPSKLTCQSILIKSIVRYHSFKISIDIEISIDRRYHQCCPLVGKSFAYQYQSSNACSTPKPSDHYGDISTKLAISKKMFEGEVYFKSYLTTPLQIFFEFIYNFKVIFKNIKGP